MHINAASTKSREKQKNSENSKGSRVHGCCLLYNIAVYNEESSTQQSRWIIRAESRSGSSERKCYFPAHSSNVEFHCFYLHHNSKSYPVSAQQSECGEMRQQQDGWRLHWRKGNKQKRAKKISVIFSQRNNKVKREL